MHGNGGHERPTKGARAVILLLAALLGSWAWLVSLGATEILTGEAHRSSARQF
jgi:hypothetical protein